VRVKHNVNKLRLLILPDYYRQYVKYPSASIEISASYCQWTSVIITLFSYSQGQNSAIDIFSFQNINTERFLLDCIRWCYRRKYTWTKIVCYPVYIILQYCANVRPYNKQIVQCIQRYNGHCYKVQRPVVHIYILHITVVGSCHTIQVKLNNNHNPYLICQTWRFNRCLHDVSSRSKVLSLQ